MLVSLWPQNFLQIYTSKVNPPVSEKLFNFSKTNTKCVQDHIKDLKNGKATGLDGIGSRILKAGAPVLSIYLSKIFKDSKGSTHMFMFF